MKHKPNPQKADRENPAWTKETFARARKARDVLPEIFGAGTAAKMLKPRGRPKSGKARTSISLRLPPDTGAMEGHGSWLANANGGNAVESRVIYSSRPRAGLHSCGGYIGGDYRSLRSPTWPHIP